MTPNAVVMNQEASGMPRLGSTPRFQDHVARASAGSSSRRLDTGSFAGDGGGGPTPAYGTLGATLAEALGSGEPTMPATGDPV